MNSKQFLSPLANKQYKSQSKQYLTLIPSNRSEGQRNGINPQLKQKEYLMPTQGYLRSLDFKQKKRYHSSNPSQRINSIDLKQRKRQKTIQKLPAINRKNKRIKSQKTYMEPTACSVLSKSQKEKRRKQYDYKRICSVNCLHAEQPVYKIRKSRPRDKIQVLRDYLYAQSKSNYPSTQLNRYLSQMRAKNQIQDIRNYKLIVYKTFFGAQPEFYKLQTMYVQQIEKPKYLSGSTLVSNRFQIPHIPQKDQIGRFIQDYTPLNQQISIQQLIKSQRFLVQYSQDELYFGQIDGNLKEGVGILINHKQLFEGLFRDDLKIRGVEVSSSGIYKGTYYNEKRQGNGQFQWFNGEHYVGEWKDGNRHGNGVWTNRYGDSYNGAWVRGRGQGYGIYIVGGQQYKGQFIDFKKQGWGREMFINGDSFQGYFKNGLPDGKGTYSWNDGTKYEGQFRQGYRNGRGLLKTIDGFTYQGQFVQEKPEGLCEVIEPNGDVYQGHLRNGRKNGRGMLILSEGDKVLDGFWEDDHFIDSINS